MEIIALDGDERRVTFNAFNPRGLQLLPDPAHCADPAGAAS